MLIKFFPAKEKGGFFVIVYNRRLTANDRLELLSKQMAKSEGVTKQLKAENQMLWVGKMSNIRNRIEEIIKEELIYA